MVKRSKAAGCPLREGRAAPLRVAAGGEGAGVGEIEAEGKTALKPGFNSVAVGRDDLWSHCARKGSEVLVEQFGGESVALMDLAPADE
jgi:hypothetical protein